MTTFIKRSLIYQYRLAVNITEYHIISNLKPNHYYKVLWSNKSFEVNYNIEFGIPIETPSQRKPISQIGF